MFSFGIIFILCSSEMLNGFIFYLFLAQQNSKSVVLHLDFVTISPQERDFRLSSNFYNWIFLPTGITKDVTTYKNNKSL